MKKADIILLVAILAVALTALAAVLILRDNSADTVVVTVDGKEYARLPLTEDTELIINSESGGVNKLTIKDGKAYMSEASCPDKVCINTGALTDITPIVCMPNNVIVSLESGE